MPSRRGKHMDVRDATTQDRGPLHPAPASLQGTGPSRGGAYCKFQAYGFSPARIPKTKRASTKRQRPCHTRETGRQTEAQSCPALTLSKRPCLSFLGLFPFVRLSVRPFVLSVFPCFRLSLHSLACLPKRAPQQPFEVPEPQLRTVLLDFRMTLDRFRGQGKAWWREDLRQLDDSN